MMITAETLRHCAYLHSMTLEGLLRKSYPKDQVLRSEFLGITNGGQFCYSVTYYDDTLEGEVTDKVFLTYDPTAGKVIADY